MSSSLFSGFNSGLTNAYAILASASGGKVTPSSISAAMSSTTFASSLTYGGNSAFASYILSNFASLDKNGDGTLSSSELSSMTNTINAQGLTAAQLTALGSASGLSNETLEQVLEHFADIDTNGDGKVSSAEIQGYKVKSAMDKKKTEFANREASNQSIFYGDDNSSSQADSSSVMAYKYWNDGSNSNQS